MSSIRVWIWKFAIRRLAALSCPERVPRSGPRAAMVNCASATLVENGNEDTAFLVDSYNDYGVEGRFWNGQSFGAEGIVPWVMLDLNQMEVTYFRGHYDFHFYGLINTYMGLLFRGYLMILFKDKAAQYLFNIRTPVRADRMLTLKALVRHRREDALNNNGILRNNYRGIDASSFLEFLHGRRIWRHPSYRETMVDVQLNLNSLESTGDSIRSNEGHFRSSDQALFTISNFEEDNRRHSDQVRHNFAIAALTCALVFVGLVQAYVTYASSSPQ
jgi:hypothetical protein